MNRYFQEKWPWIEGTHGMRLQLLDALSDEHLSFTPGGENVTLGALCRESGDVEYSYIQSLKSFQQDWSYHNETPGIKTSVAQLKAWYQQMDEEMKALVEGFSDDDLAKTIDRGTGFSVPVDMQLDIYLQAQLIFFGKASIYCNALKIEMTPTFKEYIG
ncbi:MAG TPA: DinB family protein [Ktedonobacterales bacterium]